jgi:predicted Zn-dependent protease
MTPRRRWTTAVLVLGAAACGDIANPLRSDFYEWRDILPASDGSGLDSLSFHWPADRLPVRIWVEDNANLRENMPRAIEAWRAAFLYREFDATVVSDSGAADVIVRGTSTSAPTAATLRSALAPQCQGSTDRDISDDHTQLRLPVRVSIVPLATPEDPNLAGCLALTTTHELGHVLGIWQHSSNPADLMYFFPVATSPSDRDLATAEILYHVPANVEPTGP